MRKDIEIHINTGDITLSPHNKFTLRPFNWVENEAGLMRYIYGEITLPATLSEDVVRKGGIYTTIPYTPIYEEFYVRIKREYTDGSYTYLQNPVDGTEWFLVQAAKYGGTFANIYASELFTISETSFYLKLNRGIVELYSSSESDMNIVKANRQNANLLLKCIPTNCYRYPLTGVGLIRWTQSNIDHTALANVLQREFEEDGVKVNNASYDFETNDLHLDLDTTNVDNNG